MVLGKLKEDGKFKCVKQQRGKGEHFQGIELNGQSLEIVEKFSYLGVVILARWGAVDSVTISIRRRLNAFRDLVSLLASRDFPLGTKGRLCSMCVRSETWPVKKEYMIRLDRSDPSIDECAM